MAFRMYVDDRPDVSTFGNYRSWEVSLETYVGPRYRRAPGMIFGDTNGIRSCPDLRALRSRTGTVPRHTVSYSWNKHAVLKYRTGAMPDPGPYELFTSSVPNPSDLLAFGDCLIENSADGPRIVIEHAVLSPISSPAMALWPEIGLIPTKSDPEHADWLRLTKRRHRGQFNIVFSDGHLEKLSIRNLFDIRRDDVLKRWNRDNLPHRENIPTLP